MITRASLPRSVPLNGAGLGGRWNSTIPDPDDLRQRGQVQAGLGRADADGDEFGSGDASRAHDLRQPGIFSLVANQCPASAGGRGKLAHREYRTYALNHRHPQRHANRQLQLCRCATCGCALDWQRNSSGSMAVNPAGCSTLARPDGRTAEPGADRNCHQIPARLHWRAWAFRWPEISACLRTAADSSSPAAPHAHSLRRFRPPLRERASEP